MLKKHGHLLLAQTGTSLGSMKGHSLGALVALNLDIRRFKMHQCKPRGARNAS